MRRFIKKLSNAIKSASQPAAADKIGASFMPVVETLESRQLMSVTLPGFTSLTTVALHPVTLPPIFVSPSPVVTLKPNPISIVYKPYPIITPIKVPVVPTLDAIQTKYAALGGTSGFLGSAIFGEQRTPYGNGTYQQYTGGAIFYSAATGAHDIYGAVESKYFNTAYERDAGGRVVEGVLGLPTADETNAGGVQTGRFQGGVIINSNATGAHDVYGAIGALYNSYGNASSFLGLPTTDERAIPTSRENLFQGGSIVYSNGAAHAYQAQSSMTFNTGYISFSGGTPVGGYASLTLNSDGSYVFTGHFHDSGATSYNTSLAFAVTSPSGVVYTFSHAGHTAGTFESGSRDDNWNDSGTNAALRAGWIDLQGARYNWEASTKLDLSAISKEVADIAGTVSSIVSVVAVVAA